MGKVYEKIIDNFIGRNNDFRSKAEGQYALSKNFDVFTFRHKLEPRKAFADLGSDSTVDMTNVLYVPVATVPVLYGLDTDPGKEYSYVLKYNTTSGDWGQINPAINGCSTIATRDNIFFYYKGYIYIGGSALQRFKTTEDTNFDEGYQAIALSGQPILHYSDDCAYFPAGNVLYRLDNTTWNGAVLTLPTDMYITEVTAYGDYIAIGCVTSGLTALKGGRSVVYLWDRDSSLETISQVIDFGQGSILKLANLNNILIAVMRIEGNTIVVKTADGRFANTLNTLTCDEPPTTTDNVSQTVDNRLYFPMKAPLNGDDRFGIWAVDSNGRIELEIVEPTITEYQGIYWDGDQWIICGQSGLVISTDSENNAIAEYETTFTGSQCKNYQLLSVGTMTEAGGEGTIKIEYQTEIGGSWAEIFTHTPSAGDRYHEAVNIEATGVVLPEFREIRFKVTTQRPFLGLKITYEEVDDNPGL